MADRDGYPALKQGVRIFAEATSEGPLQVTGVVDSIIVLVEHYSQLSEHPLTEVHVGECSACMVSADAFSRFVVPEISRIGQALGPVRLHSCGTSDHLLRCFLEIENLHSLDTGGGTSVSEVYVTSNEFISFAPLEGSTPRRESGGCC